MQSGHEESKRITMVARENYISREFLLGEKEHLWPRVWQIACRVEELKRPGDFVVYDIADESIIVALNKSGNIVAYHNVCPHRGRQLAQGCGHTSQYRCKFHNWAFDLDGKNIFVQDREDW
jgi:phenylpropionate dioxygenase-like ring-hydroxylating dioxygenase large terminal subunit